MPHTKPTLKPGNVAEESLTNLPQLNRARAQVGTTFADGWHRYIPGSSMLYFPPDDPGPQDADIAAYLADPVKAKWVVVTNDDGSIRHVVLASELALVPYSNTSH